MEEKMIYGKADGVRSIRREKGVFDEDEMLSRAERNYINSAERCALCGYILSGGEDVMEIYATGELIHSDCWSDYADKFSSEFGKQYEYSGTAV